MGGKILIQVKYSTDILKVWLGRVGKVSDSSGIYGILARTRMPLKK